MTWADEDVLLDLLNSTPVVDGSHQDLLADPAEASAWLRQRGGDGSPRERDAVRQVRDTLQGVLRGDLPGSALEPYLEGATYRPAMSEQGVEWSLDVPPGRAMSVRVILAWDTLERTRPGRLRPCANSECRLFLLDRSKTNRARWCSMAVCGNRMKARRHYQRTHQPPAG
ncbi:zf-CGNR multi-domain protein [Nonomuraea deserti]|uniref:Zf-CGNR multi-domain protein n=1 Tax=Nonomuraea deserti TaxID=1848322 RepID=A0A4R4V508_9ACTN|nr:CGNR zinc finger domain-containing protein [Nonomuraea deserti]TDD00218.1 zf-CGNR multi-domain protein [Nonomuraea deserti]